MTCKLQNCGGRINLQKLLNFRYNKESPGQVSGLFLLLLYRCNKRKFIKHMSCCKSSLVVLFFSVILSAPNYFAHSQTSFSNIDELELFSSELEIVNGARWLENNKYLGHPFWKVNELLAGTVVFKDETFEGLTLKYELVENDLILFKKVKDYNRVLILNRDFVERFFLLEPGTNNKHFFRKTKLPGVAGSKYYQVVYEGKTECYIYHKKVINNRVTKDYLGKYLYKPEIYVKTGTDFSKCSNKKSFLRIFTDHQKLLHHRGLPLS